MSGHSKWKTIAHKKGLADAKRGKVFSKLSKELMVAAKQGGSNPDTNLTLRTIIQKAKSANMPSDNVDRAIKKGAGETGGVVYEEVVYEGFAAGGIALIVKALTDNKNRAAAEIRHIFTKHGSNFAAQGAVTRGFVRKGQIFVDAPESDEDKIMSIVLDAGADDMERDGDQFEILTDPANFSNVMDALEKAGVKTHDSQISLVPLAYVPVKDVNVANSVYRFISDLEDNDDIQDVYTNMDIADEIVDKVGKSE